MTQEQRVMRADWIVALMIEDDMACESARTSSDGELDGGMTDLHEINHSRVLSIHERRVLRGVLSVKANRTCLRE